MALKQGDRIELRAKTKRVAPSARSGVIEQVLDEAQPRLSVRWTDGRSTVIAPIPGSYRIVPGRARRTAAATKPAAKKPVAKKSAKKS